jgi:hypothetical protein
MYLAGYYCKWARGLSQTQWLTDDDGDGTSTRVGDGSVEEQLSKVVREPPPLTARAPGSMLERILHLLVCDMFRCKRQGLRPRPMALECFLEKFSWILHQGLSSVVPLITTQARGWTCGTAGAASARGSHQVHGRRARRHGRAHAGRRAAIRARGAQRARAAAV